VLGVLLFFVGTTLWVFYQQSGAADSMDPDRVFPRFILEEVPAGLRGLLVAGVFAAAMSTVSSILNSLATVMVRDLGGSGRWATMAAARWATVGMGVLATALSLYTASLGNVLVAAGKIRSFFGGVLVGLFLLGMLSRRATAQGAFWGVIAGFASVAALGALSETSWLWYSAFSTAVTFGVGWLLSVLTQARVEAGRG
jgi:Na+/proline symporter